VAAKGGATKRPASTSASSTSSTEVTVQVAPTSQADSSQAQELSKKAAALDAKAKALDAKEAELNEREAKTSEDQKRQEALKKQLEKLDQQNRAAWQDATNAPGRRRVGSLISRFMASRAAGFSAMKRGLTLCLAVCWPLVLSGCRDTPRVAQAGPPALSVSPLPLTLPDAWLGSSTTAELTLTNTGGSTADLDLATAPPFSLRVASLRLTQGDAVSVTVHFTPQVVGPVTGEVVVGTLKVPLSAVGLEVPVCHSSSVCQVASFDFESAQCAQVANADTTACSTKCIVGACTGGACVGALKACDDGNACTIDACDEERGCSHLPLECPVPSGRCKAPPLRCRDWLRRRAGR
jgi:hypothetical protein